MGVAEPSFRPRLAPLFGMFLLLLAVATARPTKAADPDVRCEGCHAGGPRLVTDPRTGTVRDIAVAIPELRRSAHGPLACRDCHSGRFTVFPHPRDRTTRACGDCHPRRGKGAQADAAYDFPRIAREFGVSAHAGVKGFRCESCHAPHAVRTLASFATTRAALAHQNGPCLACHRRDAGDPLADPSKRGLALDHAFLPRPLRHLRSTRCVDCHREGKAAVSHHLPTGAATAPLCTTCHRRDSLLLAGLYRHRPRQGTVLGFTAPAILEDAYVTGATRSLPLDLLTYAAGGGVLLLAGAYGLRRRGRRPPAPPADPGPPLPAWLRLWHAATALLFLLLLATGAVLHFGLGGYRAAVRLHEWGGILLAALWIPHLVWLAAGGFGARYRPSGEGPGVRSLLRAHLRALAAGEPLPAAGPDGEINALRASVYRATILVTVPLLILTGLLYLAPERMPERILGLDGLWPAALLHHFLAVAAFLFLLAHLFMVAFGPAPAARLRRIFGPVQPGRRRTTSSSGTAPSP